MWGQSSKFIAGTALALMAAPLLATPVPAGAVDLGGRVAPAEIDSLPYLQCVPYARQVSGIQIYGDAWTWWGQAEGHYRRGSRPKVGAVMAFQPFGNMRLGHVAAVSRIIDSRTVLLRHSNWSPINGRRGQVEDDVRAVDVSDANDWSEVRVWYDPIQSLGGTAWPVTGFIYNERIDGAKPGRPAVLLNASYRAGQPAEPKRRDVIGEIIAAAQTRKR